MTLSNGASKKMKPSKIGESHLKNVLTERSHEARNGYVKQELSIRILFLGKREENEMRTNQGMKKECTQKGRKTFSAEREGGFQFIHRV